MKQEKILTPYLAAFALALSFAVFAGCGSSGGDNNNNGDGDSENEAETTGPDSIVPHKEKVGKFLVVYLKGTPYEMGKQQGTLLHDELVLAMQYINDDPLLGSMVGVARKKGIVDLAYSMSYEDVKEECRGLVETAGDAGLDMDSCLILNFGDILMEFITDGMPEAEAAPILKRLQPGCSEVAVSGPATKDGKLYHGRILDWDKIQYILDYPTIFVRIPDGGIPHAFIGFPANLSPYSGINAEGLSIASNEVHAPAATADVVPEHDLKGRSHVQMLAQILKTCKNMDEAKAFVRAQDHMTMELFMIADGNNKQAGVFEMTSKSLGIRELAEGVVWATNHFLAPETIGKDKQPIKEANLLRYDRFAELVSKDGKDTHYGQFDGETLISVMRDRKNPYTGEISSLTEFDNALSIATYGSLFAIVFEPAGLNFWVAAGTIPVPQQEYVGFNLGKLLNIKGATDPAPATYPAYSGQ